MTFLKSKVFLFCFLLFLLYAIAAWIYIPRFNPEGDEPHYLVITQTILKYHSLSVENDYLHKDYQSFNVLYLDPHTTINNKGHILPVHSIGAPLLFLLPFAFLARGGVLVFLAFISTLIVYNIYQFLLALQINNKTSFFVSSLFAFVSPVFVFAHLNFIEPIAALICMYTLRKILLSRLVSNKELIWISLCIAFLLILHIRFVLIEIPLICFYLYAIYKQKQKRMTSLLAFLIPLIVLTSIFELYTHAIWNSWNPAINYIQASVFTSHVFPLRGIIGILFDQEYGIIFNFPIFLFLIPGIIFSIKDRLYKINLLIALLAIPYILLFTSFPDWKGGWTPAGRYILVLLPLFSFYIAYAIAKTHGIIKDISLFIGILWGSVTSYLSLFATFHGFNIGTGKSSNILFLQDIFAIHKHITSYLPSVFGNHFAILIFFIFGISIWSYLMLIQEKR